MMKQAFIQYSYFFKANLDYSNCTKMRENDVDQRYDKIGGKTKPPILETGQNRRF